MAHQFRKAKTDEINVIWHILQQAIIRRQNDGSSQWQDGYPNLQIIENDIENGQGFVLLEEDIIVGYCAILINNEPAYQKIEGKWLSNGNFVVVHRVAIAAPYLGKGLASIIIKNIEKFAQNNNIHSVKADTNYDNIAMLKTFEKAGYTYCGEVYFRGNPRKAYEKVLETAKNE
jgi:RimJ/RimL family protein N-acetyltransferase